MVVTGKTYGQVAWVAADISKCRPDWTAEQCNEWLRKHEEWLQETMCRAGWGYIEQILGPRLPQQGEVQ
jgi:hypothetical protein